MRRGRGLRLGRGRARRLAAAAEKTLPTPRNSEGPPASLPSGSRSLGKASPRASSGPGIVLGPPDLAGARTTCLWPSIGADGQQTNTHGPMVTREVTRTALPSETTWSSSGSPRQGPGKVGASRSPDSLFQRPQVGGWGGGCAEPEHSGPGTAHIASVSLWLGWGAWCLIQTLEIVAELTSTVLFWRTAG